MSEEWMAVILGGILVVGIAVVIGLCSMSSYYELQLRTEAYKACIAVHTADDCDMRGRR